MDKSSVICMGCMSPANGEEICPRCGYNHAAENHSLYLNTGTMLKDRYIVGKLLSRNGEGASYIGYDTSARIKVIVHEYMPEVIAGRQQGAVVPYKGKETQYKALMADFFDLVKTVAKLRGYPCVIPVTDAFEANNTVYALYEYTEGTTLFEAVTQKGPIPLSTLRLKLMPIATMLEALHGMGKLHRGISPKNIIIDNRGDFRITGFSIASARTAQSEITAELFQGYAPPELYTGTGWQGAWTDVYSLGAVIYFALTCIAPQSAPARKANDELRELHTIEGSVPLSVSLTISQAMELNPEERLQKVSDLIKGLTDTEPLASHPQGHSYVRGNNMYNQETNTTKKEMIKKRKARTFKRNLAFMFGSMAITTTILLTLMFIILGEVDQNLLVFNKENGNADGTPDVTMVGKDNEEVYKLPDFKGSYIDSIKSKGEYLVKYTITETEEYNEEYPAGVIFDQDQAPGTPIGDKALPVEVKVSKGSAPIPDDIVGKTQEEAEAILTELEVKYTVVTSFDNTVEKGCVVRVTKLPTEIMLIVSEGRMDGGTSGNDGDGDDDNSNGLLNPDGSINYEKWFS